MDRYLESNNSDPSIDEEFMPHRRDFISRISRKMREKINCGTDNLMPARKVRKRRSRRQAFSGDVKSPRKIMGSRFRKR